MKYILTILSLLVLIAANAQTPVTPSPKGGWIKANSSYGTIQDRISAGKVFLFPTSCGTPAELYGTDLGQAALFFDSCGNTLYNYNPKLHTWSPIEGGGGGSSLPYNADSTYYLAGDTLLHQFVELKVHDTCCGTSHISNDTLFVVGGNSSTVLQDGLVTPGYVTWSGTGLTYDVTSATYIVNGITYVSDAGSVTLDVADPDNPRIDVIAVDTLGHIVAITGDPAPNPAEPQVDPESQVLLTSISVPAGALVPIGVTQNIIYDENTENYTGTTSGITLNLDNTTTPYHLTKSANVGSWTTTRNINFTQNSGTSNASDYTMLKMYIWLKQPITGGLRVSFLNGETLVSNILTVAPGVGYNKTLDSSYQNISIPMSSFVFTNNTFNKIRITVTGTGAGFYLDYLQLQGGVYPPADENPYVINFSKNATRDSIKLQLSNGVNYIVKDSAGGAAAGNYGNIQLNRNSAFATPASDSLSYNSGELAIKGNLHLNTSAGTGGTDSVLVQSGGIVKRISGTYYGPSSGSTTANALTFNNSGSGDASGTTFNGGAARTLSYNSIGAMGSLTTTGTTGSASYTPSTGVLNVPNYNAIFNGFDSGFVPYAKYGGGFYYRRAFKLDTTTTNPTLRVPDLLIDSLWKFTKISDPQSSGNQSTMFQVQSGITGRSSRLYFGSPFSPSGTVSFEGLSALQLINFTMRQNPSTMSMNGGSSYGEIFGSSPSYRNAIINVSGNATQSDFVIVADATSRTPNTGLSDSAIGEMMRIKGVSRRIGVNKAHPLSTFDIGGSFSKAYAAKAASYTLTEADNTIEVTATGQTITLPTAVGIKGRVYTIKLTASGSGTVATTSSQTIDGSTTYSLSAQYKYVTVMSNDANWIITANN